jgi:hypothetical protein
MRRLSSGALLLLLGCRSADHSGAATATLETRPEHALEQLDSRKPVPLLPMMAHHQKQNMRDHLVVVQEIVAAAATQDFSRVASAAKRIGYSETMGQMCQHLGAGAPGFTEQALAFHRLADRIGEAANRNDATAVLTSLGETLAACTACHAAYKQKLVASLPE